LASLQAVDLVIPFSELNPEHLIRTIIPDVLAKGSDYSLENIVGAAFVLENKGEVVRIPLLPDISTTKMADFMLKKNDQDAN
jgi:bifunctional ADP-heptose synthase (sugar kinase/adenylyltransferase)